MLHLTTLLLFKVTFSQGFFFFLNLNHYEIGNPLTCLIVRICLEVILFINSFLRLTIWIYKDQFDFGAFYLFFFFFFLPSVEVRPSLIIYLMNLSF